MTHRTAARVAGILFLCATVPFSLAPGDGDPAPGHDPAVVISYAGPGAGLRVDVVARQNELQRVAETDESRQALRAPVAGDDPERNLGQAELRGRRGESQIARER